MTSRTSKKIASERWGRQAELLAGIALMFKGYRIISWRFRTKLGEIDLIAKKGDVIAIVEVKARKTVAEAADAVDWESQRRINNAADMWLSKQRKSDKLSIRFDIMAVCPWRWPVHMKDAF